MVKILIFWIILLYVSILLPSTLEAETASMRELYVRPTATTHCPKSHHPCHTLDQYVQNATHYFVSNTTFRFLTGAHNLSQTISVFGVAQLAMVTDNGFVNILCRYDSYILFTEVLNLTLRDLTFLSCNTLKLLNVHNLMLLSISMQLPPNSSGGIDGTNIMGASTVADFRFLPLASNSEQCVDTTHSVTLWYADLLTLTTSNSFETQLVIRDSVFDCPSSSTWLGLELKQTTYSVSVSLQNITASGEVKFFIIGMYLLSPNANLVNITGLFVKPSWNFTAEPYYAVNVFNILTPLDKVQQSTVYVGNSYLSQGMYAHMNSAHLLVSDCVFSNLSQVYMAYIGIHYQSMVAMRNVTFTDLVRTSCNSTIPCCFIYLYHVQNVVFIDCKFTKNVMKAIGTERSILSLQKSSNITFKNCEFSENTGTPLVALDSTFIVSGFNNFSYNQADEGGALAFFGASFVWMSNDSKVLFQSNKAKIGGGAIYVDYGFDSPCFVQLSTSDYCSGVYTLAEMTFGNNIAGIGGTAIYGASLDTCKLGVSSCYGWNLVNGLLPSNNALSLSTISSQPVRTCLCNEDGIPSCTDVFRYLEYCPGEEFKIPAVVVGDRFGTVDGSVHAQVSLTFVNDGDPRFVSISQQEVTQAVNHAKCTDLHYTIFSNMTGFVIPLVLTAKSTIIQDFPSLAEVNDIDEQINIYNKTGHILPLLRSFPVYITVKLRPCPLGFVLSHDALSHCVCDKQLRKHDVQCHLATKTIQVSENIWISGSFKNDEGSGVVLSTNCPNGYCKSEFQTVNVSLDDPDAQCAYHHSGILCGGCQSGRSLALGSNRCLHCSDDYLALLIPFGLAGFALVLFMKLFNLTVAEGAINGLIFYANIIRASRMILTPGDKTNFLTVFIAWLNLDLGIEACFFDGMDAYWKMWLEFVFPLYIWMLVILIIVLARYFSLVAKIFGNNLVPVLATLCLLSYSKILRVIITILQSSTLHYPDGTTERVWSYDGNIAYFSAKHIPLVLVAFAFIVFLWSPYTAFLTFTQCILRSSNYNVTKLLFKFKPFLDAYYGPFKDKHRYWVGLLLLVRGALFAVLAATSSDVYNVNFLVILTLVLCLLVYLSYSGSVYRNVYHGLLENSFFLNLGILAGGTLYVRSSGGSQTALANASMGIAFALFVAIVAYQLFVLLRRQWPQFLRKRNQLQGQKIQSIDRSLYQDITSSKDSKDHENSQCELDNTCRDFREPVLKYLDSQT